MSEMNNIIAFGELAQTGEALYDKTTDTGGSVDALTS